MNSEQKEAKWLRYDRDCNLCGAPLAIGRTATGKEVQLDLLSPVYQMVFTNLGRRLGLEVVRSELALVDHKVICPHART